MNTTIVPHERKPSLMTELRNFGTFPKEAVYIGCDDSELNEDGNPLPILINTYNKETGASLIEGDNRSSIIRFMGGIVEGIELMDRVDRLINSVVVTKYPSEWAYFSGYSTCTGIFPSYADRTMDMLYSLGGWAKTARKNGESVCLFIDDIEMADELDFDYKQMIKWLMTVGSYSGVFVFVSGMPHQISQVIGKWESSFRRAIYTKNGNCAYKEVDGKWLNFRMPEWV